jgi:hypothetical protein
MGTYPSCFNAYSQLDTTCKAVLTEKELNCNSYWAITSLNGVQYFKNLKQLNCGSTQLTSLPTLPKGLTKLNCNSTQLTSLPTLPTSLKTLSIQDNRFTTLPALPTDLEILNCGGNQIAQLSALPVNLKILNCGGNQLTSLPILPKGLTELNCDGNQLTSLPDLPTSLKTLSIGNNHFTTLPALPVNLKILNCGSNQLTSLPLLPKDLIELNCDGNQLTSLPLLPKGLMELGCSGNQLTSLPILPKRLITLWCNGNQITSFSTLPDDLKNLNCENNLLISLPSLPKKLEKLDCAYNKLIALPTLPDSLVELQCYVNQLKNLPALPKSLTQLWCSSNQLKNLPALPISLMYLNCSENQLQSLPALPKNLTGLLCDHNPNLSCLPYLPSKLNSLSLDSMAITCLPNKPKEIVNTYPIYPHLTQVCNAYAALNGKVYLDDNGNNCYDSGERLLPDFVIRTLPINEFSAQTYSNANGYNILVNANVRGAEIINLDTSTFVLTTSIYNFKPRRGDTIGYNFGLRPRKNTKYVTIPDPIFRKYLKHIHPTCLNALEQLDTTCKAVLSDTAFDCSWGVSNLEGIRYFKNLKYLNCWMNKLTHLPNLPLGLTHLICDQNELTSLPTLPVGLKFLHCPGNMITHLPTLPTTLGQLYCNQNRLTTLPALPTSMTILVCDQNQLKTLPTLPINLEYLHCTSNQLTCLPTLPASLTELQCGGNPNLAHLPYLPNKLSVLGLDSTAITCLPNRPGNKPYFPTNIPICTDLTKVNNGYAHLRGKVFLDANKNNKYDKGEPLLPNFIIKVLPATKIPIEFYSDNTNGYDVVIDSSVRSIEFVNTYPNAFTLKKSSYNFVPIRGQNHIYDFALYPTNIATLESEVNHHWNMPSEIKGTVFNVGSTNPKPKIVIHVSRGWVVDSIKPIGGVIQGDSVIWQETTPFAFFEKRCFSVWVTGSEASLKYPYCFRLTTQISNTAPVVNNKNFQETCTNTIPYFEYEFLPSSLDTIKDK